MFKNFFGENKEIKFSCEILDWDVIPKPYPSKKFIPDWYKALPMHIGGKHLLQSSTIKRCNPFFDAMAAGYIIPLAADVEFITNEDASGVTYKTNYYRKIIENHRMEQVTTEKCPNPSFPKPPMKFLNYWFIETPPGWSTLFVPPINRADPRFTCISGLVDTDKHFEYINFPFFFNEPNFQGIIPAGTPLVQARPIKRSELLNKNKIQKFTKKDWEKIELARRQRSSHESLYRDYLVEKK